MSDKARKYQKDGIDLIGRQSAALFWEMGLGKTFAVLSVLPEDPSLSIVVCPKAVSHTWLSEADKWRPDIQIIATIDMLPNKRASQRDLAIHHCRHKPTILLMNYEQAKETYKWLKSFNYKCQAIVADESSWIKSHRAQRTKSMIALRSLAHRAYALSGTPILHGPIDLYSQMNFVHPDILPENWWAFRARYAVLAPKQFGDGKPFQQIIDYQNLDELTARLQPWSMSLKKEDVAPDLPPKIYQTRTIDLDDKERKNYETIRQEMKLAFPEGGFVPLPNALSKLIKLMQGSSGFYYYDIPVPGSVPFEDKYVIEHGRSKRKEIIAMLDNELSGSPVIIWSALRWEQWRLAEELKEAGHEVNSKYFDKTALKAAENFIDGKGSVLVASAAELGYGMNLQIASNEIFASNNFKYGDREQAEARCHRIGQQNPVTIIDILANKTTDLKTLNILKKKGDLADLIMDELGVKIRK